MKRLVKAAVNSLGFKVTRLGPSPELDEHKAVLRYWLGHLGIDLFLDVGANSGQTARGVRQCGYAGHIVSFEPHPMVYARLCQAMDGDPKWEGQELALGEKEGTATLNDAANDGLSSSLLKVSDDFKHLEPGIFGESSSFEVKVKTLDQFFEAHKRPARHVFLKMDAQGYESNILAGAKNSIERISAIQLELSLFSVYEEQPNFLNVCNLLKDLGFRMVWITPGFRKLDLGQMFEVDALFVKDAILRSDLRQRATRG